MSQNVIAAERLYLTADKEQLVADGDERAAFLYATEGDEIPEEMAKKFGLVDGKLKSKKAAEPKTETKSAAGAQSKPAKPAATKPAKSAATKPAKSAATKPAVEGENKPAEGGETKAAGDGETKAA
ncbi:hypothetical protein [Erythrobacter sp. WG]|uniref:hypothetical protein n=1 Tax=Erythrobacter sp. WG TaxID=2985510 RepID=UPI00226FCF42|nr:hypothetical protein [Erythrobacter sp. WG]MCX9146614.1 hypothetical protein [Erythrobacter sp. WG]